jgi:NADPH:quinone reductase-like Zn-dependent oxidoreductase
VQIAARAGATVIATTRAEKFDEVKRLGAHHVIDYRANADFSEALAAAAPGGITRVADGALWLTLEAVLPVAATARPHRRLCERTSNPPRRCLLQSCSTPTRPSRRSRSSACRRLRSRPPSDGVNDLLAQGALEHKIGARFGFDDMIDAHEAMETIGVDGACIVSMRG